MNNKKVGSDFEREFCELLAKSGWWVKFLDPDKTGSQPFDVIAVKNGQAYVFDCKTCSSDTFNIRRLEDNQIMAFEKWIKCGNNTPLIVIKHKNKVYIISYPRLRSVKSIRIEDEADLIEEVFVLWRLK